MTVWRSLLLFVFLAFPRLSQAQEIRAFWADAFNEAIKTPAQVDTLLARLRQANCNAVFAQVRKGGDAYYQSRYEPWASDNPERFDALAYLIQQAHGGSPRIAVHAWINTCAVGGGRGNPRHIAVAHPDWLSISSAGSEHDGEATKIDPGHPDAADWTFRVYLDVLRHYDVDGIHFDFVRYGGADWGYNPVSVRRFNARFGRSGSPVPGDALWQQWRRDQVTALVRKVYLMSAAVKPRAAVSAATVTWGAGPTDVASWNAKTASMTRVFQDWRSWLREGILDVNCQMAYYREARHAQWFRQWIEWGKDNQFGRWVVPGCGAWFNPISSTIRQLDAIRSPSRRGNRPHGALIYSYAGTDSTGDREQQHNEALYSALARPSVHGAAPFPSPAAIPTMPWKEGPSRGHIVGFILTAGALEPVDGALVTVTGPSALRQRTDGTGFVGFANLPPGRYRIAASAPGYAGIVRSVVVQAGRVTRVVAFAGTDMHRTVCGADEAVRLRPGTPVFIPEALVVGGSDTFVAQLFVVSGSDQAVRVRLPAPLLLALQPGDRVVLSGLVSTDSGEPLIDCQTVRLTGISPAAREPEAELVLSSGASRARVVSVGRGRIRVRGKVTASRPGSIEIDAGLPITAILEGRKDVDVDAAESPIASPEAGSEVEVTGIMTRAMTADNLPRHVVRPIQNDDLHIISGALAARVASAGRWAAGPLFRLPGSWSAATPFIR